MKRSASQALAPNADALAFRGTIFDLDGVVTDTARVHARVWKVLFDSFLERHAADARRPFYPFDEELDYRRYVDGKPRYDGVRSFLASRDIVLDDGDPDDSSERETICGLGNHKDRLFIASLARNGVRVFRGAVALAQQLRALGVQVALASSSRNAEAILASAGLADLFPVRVDGVMAAELGLQGKPAPDIFLECARRLGVRPVACVVVEDAVSGVSAARAGSFELVIGIASGAESDTLLANGADVVVANCDDVSAHTIDAWCKRQGPR